MLSNVLQSEKDSNMYTLPLHLNYIRKREYLCETLPKGNEYFLLPFKKNCEKDHETLSFVY